MDTKDVILLVRETFDEEISSWAAETVLGLESGIDGSQKFFESLERKLNERSNNNPCPYCRQPQK